jgi:hypothetical protein
MASLSERLSGEKEIGITDDMRFQHQYDNCITMGLKYFVVESTGTLTLLRKMCVACLKNRIGLEIILPPGLLSGAVGILHITIPMFILRGGW